MKIFLILLYCMHYPSFMSFDMKHHLSAIITRSGKLFVSFCPELGVTSQGENQKDAIANLKEAVELYLEDDDVQARLKKFPIKKAIISSIEVTA